MATLEDSVKQEISDLEAQIAVAQTKLDAAKSQLETFGPWLKQELTEAEAAIKSFFDKFRSPSA